MSILSGIIVYLLIWWTVIFCTLPLGIKSNDSPRDGSMPGAPVHHGMKRKVILTTIISCVVWLVIFLIITYSGFSFREMVQKDPDVMSGYCKIAPGHPVHHDYHESEYGFPVEDERVLFERLSLEIMQAGLSWEITLKKRKGLNRAFDRFAVSKVAKYGARDVKRLLADEGIIRNRLKINAIIENAKRVLELRKSHKGFAGWLAAHHPLTKPEWVKLFKKQFLFTGGEIVGEFLMSIGYLPGAHHEKCAVFGRIKRRGPPWMKTQKLPANGVYSRFALGSDT